MKKPIGAWTVLRLMPKAGLAYWNGAETSAVASTPENGLDR
jgi:hypothetical protein